MPRTRRTTRAPMQIKTSLIKASAPRTAQFLDCGHSYQSALMLTFSSPGTGELPCAPQARTWMDEKRRGRNFQSLIAGALSSIHVRACGAHGNSPVPGEEKVSINADWY